jgi:hypothetical protein
MLEGTLLRQLSLSAAAVPAAALAQPLRALHPAPAGWLGTSLQWLLACCAACAVHDGGKCARLCRRDTKADVAPAENFCKQRP